MRGAVGFGVEGEARTFCSCGSSFVVIVVATMAVDGRGGCRAEVGAGFLQPNQARPSKEFAELAVPPGVGCAGRGWPVKAGPVLQPHLPRLRLPPHLPN